MKPTDDETVKISEIYKAIATTKTLGIFDTFKGVKTDNIPEIGKSSYKGIDYIIMDDISGTYQWTLPSSLFPGILDTWVDVAQDGFNALTVLGGLAEVLPGLKVRIKHPCQGDNLPIREIIISLNDKHKWSRERIADWLDTLDVDLNFSPQIGTNDDRHENP